MITCINRFLDVIDPQAPGGGGNPPPAGNGGGNPPPAGNGGGNPPAGNGGGNPPAAGNGGGNPPPAGNGGGNPPAAGNGGGNPPAAGNGGGNPPAAGNGGGNPPAGNGGGNPPAAGNGGGNPPAGNGGNQPAGPAGGQPAGGQPAGGQPTPAAGGKTPATPAGALPAGGTTTPANNTTNSTTNSPPKYIDPLTPSVQIKMIEPKLAKNILYKIGSNITFKWTYTADFQDPPKSISAYAQPEISVNSNNYFAIALNISLSNIQEVVWVTANNASSLPMAKYKLWICDERGLTAPANPGGLQVFSGLEFGLYQSQSNGDTCPNCGLNGISGAISIPIIPFLSTIGFALITIISFNFILI